ncbi:hypothetical protein TGDOM2_308940 [Toxoplasma gondii GAB2-2007-GAL-DOM2]|uniref:Transmembrane protein n=3 Tax=Toxoplasma gondii TaxID=5811 RepID=A0A086LG99_TOXGO|nr:hypothetical protein TGDOM2_308940 [Toxoplasma gondii GAB2-2007-GAL-DOM2]KFG55667.1 hypothetical protein TGFOU_308940 [Toxoplasma gondii FOU]PUA92061.1 hypothetical protein TGBR9_308940 [Toxoplasma gondii TgCATBr9]
MSVSRRVFDGRCRAPSRGFQSLKKEYVGRSVASSFSGRRFFVVALLFSFSLHLSSNAFFLTPHNTRFSSFLSVSARAFPFSSVRLSPEATVARSPCLEQDDSEETQAEEAERNAEGTPELKTLALLRSRKPSSESVFKALQPATASETDPLTLRGRFVSRGEPSRSCSSCLVLLPTHAASSSAVRRGLPGEEEARRTREKQTRQVRREGVSEARAPARSLRWNVFSPVSKPPAFPSPSTLGRKEVVGWGPLRTTCPLLSFAAPSSSTPSPSSSAYQPSFTSRFSSFSPEAFASPCSSAAFSSSASVSRFPDGRLPSLSRLSLPLHASFASSAEDVPRGSESRVPARQMQDIFREAKLRRRSLYEVAETFDRIAREEYSSILKQVVEEAGREMRDNELRWQNVGEKKKTARERLEAAVSHDEAEVQEAGEASRDEEGRGRTGEATRQSPSLWPSDALPARGDVREVSRNMFVLSVPERSDAAPSRSSPSAPMVLNASSALADAFPAHAWKPATEAKQRETVTRLDERLSSAQTAAAVLSFADARLAFLRLSEVAKVFGRVCQVTKVRGEELKDDPRYERLVTALDLRLQEELQAVTQQIALEGRRMQMEAQKREQGNDGASMLGQDLRLRKVTGRETDGQARGWRQESSREAREAGRQGGGQSEGRREGDRVAQLQFELRPADLVALAQALRRSHLALDLDMLLRNMELIALLQLPSFSLQQLCEFIRALGYMRTTGLRPLSRPFLSRAVARVGDLLAAALNAHGKPSGEQAERTDGPAARNSPQGRTVDERGDRQQAAMSLAVCPLLRETGYLQEGHGRIGRGDITTSLLSAVNDVVETLPFLSTFEEESFLPAERRTAPVFTKFFRRTLGRAWAEMAAVKNPQLLGDCDLVGTHSLHRHRLGSSLSPSLEDLRLLRRGARGAREGRDALEGAGDKQEAGEAHGETRSDEREASKRLQRINELRCVAKTVRGVLKASDVDDQTVISALTRSAVSLVSDHWRDESREGEAEAQWEEDSLLARELARARALLEVLSALSEAGALSQELWWAVRRDLRRVLPYLSLYHLDLAGRLHCQSATIGRFSRRVHSEDKRNKCANKCSEARGEVDDAKAEQPEARERQRGERREEQDTREETETQKEREQQEEREKREETQFLEALLRVFRARTRSMNNRELSTFADRLVARPAWLGTANSPSTRDLVATVFSEIRERYIDAKEETHGRPGLMLRPLMNLALLAGGWGVISLQVMFDFLCHSLQSHRADLETADLLVLSESLHDFAVRPELLHEPGLETLLFFILDKVEETVETLRKSAADLPDDLHAELQNFSLADSVRGKVHMILGALTPFLRALATLEKEISVALGSDAAVKNERKLEANCEGQSCAYFLREIGNK